MIISIIICFFISKKRLSKAKLLSHFFEIKKPISYANRFSFAEKEGLQLAFVCLDFTDLAILLF